MSESAAWQFPLSGSASIGLIHAYDHVVAADCLRMELPDPPFAAWFVRRGSVTVQFKDSTRYERAVTAGKHQWLFLPSRPRQHQMTPGTHLLSVRMNLERSHVMALITARQTLCVPQSQAPHLVPLATTLVESLRQQGTERSMPDELLTETSLRAAFLLWITEYLRVVLAGGWKLTGESLGTTPVEKVLAWIQRQPFSTPLRQPDLARTAGLSLSHIKRLFQRDLGISPIDWWQNRRLKEACKLLRETNLPLKVIAGDLAFRFPSHFSIWFRKRVGLSPLAFRQKLTVDV